MYSNGITGMGMMPQGLAPGIEIKGLQTGVSTASPAEEKHKATRPRCPAPVPLCVSILIGDGDCARAAMHTRARAAPG